MNKEITFIPDRLNEEPVIFIGMSDSELKLTGMVSVGFWIPVCLTFTILMGYGILGIALGAALAFVTMWLCGKRLTAIKRSKPKQFHVQYFTAWLEDRGFKRKTIIRHSRVWDIHRNSRKS